MKTLLTFLFAILMFISCVEPSGKDVEIYKKFDTTTIKKNDTIKVQSLFGAAPSGVSQIVNPYDMHCGGLPPYKDSIKFAGNLYGFCGINCKNNFKRSPSSYLK